MSSPIPNSVQLLPFKLPHFIALAIVLSWFSLIFQYEKSFTEATEWGSYTFNLDIGSGSGVYKVAGAFIFLVCGICAINNSERGIFPGYSFAALFALTLYSGYWQFSSYDIGIEWLHSLLGATGPFVWMICFGVFAGARDDIWPIVEKCAWVISIGSLFLSYRYYLSLPAGGYFVTGSPAVFYLVPAIWFSIYLLFNSKDRISFLLSCSLIFCCLLMAILGAHRSWILMVVLAFLLSIKQSLRANLLKKNDIIIAIFLAGIIGIILTQVETNFDFINLLLSKGFEDTRSNQYATFFSSIEWTDLFFGLGPKATYSFRSLDEYNYFDNQFIYASFKFGFVTVVSYFILVIFPGIKCLMNRRDDITYSIGVVLGLWILALSGLSVYNAIHHSPQNYLIVLLAGRAYAEQFKYSKYPPAKTVDCPAVAGQNLPSDKNESST